VLSNFCENREFSPCRKKKSAPVADLKLQSLFHFTFFYLCDFVSSTRQMATQSLPSTPKAATPLAPTSDGTGTPGKWRHPMLAEIVRRQNAATFDEKNVKRLVWNGAAFIMTCALGGTVKQ
jgi:hypothetical protein